MKKQYLLSCIVLLSGSFIQHTFSAMHDQHHAADNQAVQRDRCAICLDDMPYVNVLNRRIRLGCNHRFHRRCINQHFWSQNSRYQNASCPLCRQAVNGNFTIDDPDQAERAAMQRIKHIAAGTGTALIITGALAYKYRKPLINILAQAKAKVQHTYSKFRNSRLFKPQEAQDTQNA